MPTGMPASVNERLDATTERAPEISRNPRGVCKNASMMLYTREAGTMDSANDTAPDRVAIYGKSENQTKGPRDSGGRGRISACCLGLLILIV